MYDRKKKSTYAQVLKIVFKNKEKEYEFHELTVIYIDLYFCKRFVLL